MPYVRYEVNFIDYLHEKAQESRHKETEAYLMFLAGIIFFVGGILETLKLAGTPEWFIFIPYHTEPLAGAVLGLSLIMSGLSLMVFGVVAGLTYYSRRRWCIEELRKASSKEWLELQRRRVKKSTPHTQKRKKGKSNL